LKRLILTLSLFILVFHCKPNPEVLFEEARKKLKEENPSQARELMELAYDLSLPESMLPLGYKDKFQAGTISQSKRILTLVKSIDQSIIVFYYLLSAEKPQLSNKFELKLTNYDDIISSPNGIYTIIQSFNEDKKCLLTVISVEDKNSQVVPADSISCKNRPAVTDSGTVYFSNESSLQTYDYQSSRIKKLSLAGFDLNLKLINRFYTNANNKLFLTQGIGGIYTLYSLKPGKIAKIKSDISSGTIIFSGNNEPIIVLGGAGNYVLVQLSTNKPGSFTKVIEKVRFDRLQFLSNNDYIFTEYGLLSLNIKGKTKELSFWVNDFFVGPNQRIYLLSKSGILLIYNEFVMSELNRKIFREGAVLYEGG
jgi:hypothetical protein